MNRVANQHRESVAQQRKTRVQPALEKNFLLTHARTHTHTLTKSSFTSDPVQANPHRLQEISKAVFILFSTSKDSLVAQHQMPREGDAKNVASAHSGIACTNAEWRALQRPYVTRAQLALHSRGEPKMIAGTESRKFFSGITATSAVPVLTNPHSRADSRNVWL